MTQLAYRYQKDRYEHCLFLYFRAFLIQLRTPVLLGLTHLSRHEPTPALAVPGQVAKFIDKIARNPWRHREILAFFVAWRLEKV
jgi:hypothetical protein